MSLLVAYLAAAIALGGLVALGVPLWTAVIVAVVVGALFGVATVAGPERPDDDRDTLDT